MIACCAQQMASHSCACLVLQLDQSVGKAEFLVQKNTLLSIILKLQRKIASGWNFFPTSDGLWQGWEEESELTWKRSLG